MKQRFLTLTIAAMFVMPATLFAGGSSSGDATKCMTKYPIVMVHGIAVKDENLLGIDYWWGIVDDLEDAGATVFVTQQHTFQSHEFRAKEVFNELLNLRAMYGYQKFNIIAHSQGGLDSRFLITNLSTVLPATDRTMPNQRITGAKMVASLSTVSGVHRGTAVADVLLGIIPSPIANLGCTIIDLVAELFFYNETNSDSKTAFMNLTRKFMNGVFNPNTPNVAGVYYQSWAGKIKWLTSELVLTPTWLLLKMVEGENDGMVSVNSAKWGTFRGVVSGAWWCGGVSHFNEINHLFGITPGFDAEGFYVDMAADLKSKGY